MRCLIILVAVAAVKAQLEHPYEHHEPARTAFKSAIHRLPQQNNMALLEEEVPFRKMYKFGTPVPMNVSVADGHWTETDTGRVWSMTFQSPGAHSMNVKFSRFKIPHGAALFIHGQEGQTVHGAFTEKNNYKNGEFVHWPIDGDHLTLEYFQPKTSEGEPILDVQHVIHGYKQSSDCGDSGWCNKNSACDSQFGGLHTDQIRAGALILHSYGYALCSGSMINTMGSTGRQLFLTAEHCGGSPSNFGSLKFQFASSQCTPTNCPSGRTIGDINILHMRAQSDTALLEVGERIPDSWNVYLSGFSASTSASSSVVGIHHPAGDVQKISYSFRAPYQDSYSWWGPNTHWTVSRWDNQTTTEPGSSGSPLYDDEQRIIGQLTGGSASCSRLDGYDTYGALYHSWNDGMRQYLNPNGFSGRETDGSYLNDARNSKNIRLNNVREDFVLKRR